MGLFSTKTTTKTNEKFDTGPSSWQKPYLDSAFGAAQDMWSSSKGTPYYQGDTYAGMNGDQKAALERLSGYAGGQGMAMGSQISALGSGMVGHAGERMVTNLDRFTTMAGEDATASNIAAAQRYADNPWVQGMIDANSRDVTRNLYENEIPGIDRAASSSGNINSSRAGVASGIAQRGAGDRIADISASIRGDAYNRGLSMAQQDRATTLDAYGRAADAYGQMTSMGLNAMGQGSAMQYDALGRQIDVQDAYRQDRQGEMDAAFDKWKGEDTRTADLLNRYYSIIGGNQWGQSGTSSSKTTGKQSGGLGNQLISAGASIASAAVAASDPRLKTNVKLIGRLEDGLGVYTFFYDRDLSDEFHLDLPQGLQVGVMADEVAELRPHAMGPTLNGGFMSVNYTNL